MRTIKMFRGSTPPSLKKGEWASDGDYAYLGMEHGEYKVFQGVFELGKSQKIAGFQYNLGSKAILIPSGTPFSKLQRLIDALPKSLKYSSNEQASVDILFENGNYINDLGTSLVLRDFSFQLNFKSLSDTTDGNVGIFAKPVIFHSDNAIQVYNSAVHFSDIRFRYSDPDKGALWFLNGTTRIDDCCFDAQVDSPCVTDKGYNKLVFSDTYFKMKTNEISTILDKASVGSFINVARCKSDTDFRPKSIAANLEGGFIVAGNVDDLHIADKSPVDMPMGGVEIHGGLVTNTDGGLNIAVPSKISQLENDLAFTKDYKELENKPVTISAAQAKAIADNSEKASYPNEDKAKLAGIEEKATVGATKDQAEAIAWNSLKNSYPDEDKKKLAEIEERATYGATPEQAQEIMVNSQKRTYPLADRNKLETIEENATVGATKEQADAIRENSAKRTFPEACENKLAGIEKKATVGADWQTNLNNIPPALKLLADALTTADINSITIKSKGKKLVLGSDE